MKWSPKGNSGIVCQIPNYFFEEMTAKDFKNIGFVYRPFSSRHIDSLANTITCFSSVGVRDLSTVPEKKGKLV